MDLVPYMYFEKQEAGSQLCAQHCINNLLQSHNYDEFDLADVARRLDDAENAALATDRQNKSSYNYDDTGFFSISVLERALEVWDLTLVRWRGEAMKAYQEHPEEQSAFILNLASHWLPLRRFGPFPPHHNAVRRWYNMNSFLPQPEWISPTYLRMVLEQAEKEGYSVFVVRKASNGNQGQEGDEEENGEGVGWTDGGVAQMPECLADTMAVELGEPVGRTGGQGGGVGQGTDKPSVDPSSTAGPSSPPAARRKRQQDLSGDDITDDPFLAAPSRSYAAPSGSGSASQPIPIPDDADEDISESEAFGFSGATDFQHASRSYDDEDAALQAALRASMEDVPEGWVAPDLQPKRTTGRKLPETPTLPPAQVMPEIVRQGSREEGGAAGGAPAAPAWRVAGEAPATPEKQAGTNKEKEEDAEEIGSPMEELSADEIRRRRLAKFGM